MILLSTNVYVEFTFMLVIPITLLLICAFVWVSTSIRATKRDVLKFTSSFKHGFYFRYTTVHWQKNIQQMDNVTFPDTSKSFFSVHSSYHSSFTVDKNHITWLSKSQFADILFNKDKNNNNYILTPYCINAFDSTVVFTCCPRHVICDNASSMTFFFQTQIKYGAALGRLYAIKFDDLKRILDEYQSINYNTIEEGDDSSSVKENYNVLFIHNMGRCGSNLVCDLIADTFDHCCGINYKARVSNGNYKFKYQKVIKINETQILRQIATNYANFKDVGLKDNVDNVYKLLIELSVRSLVAAIVSSVQAQRTAKENRENEVKIIIKSPSQITWISSLICDIFSDKHNFRHIYLYRNRFDQIDSMCAAVSKLFFGYLGMYNIIHIWEKLDRFSVLQRFMFDNENISWFVNDKKMYQKDLQSYKYFCEFIALGWVLQMNIAVDLLSNKKFEFALDYDKLLVKKQSQKHVYNCGSKMVANMVDVVRRIGWISDNDAKIAMERGDDNWKIINTLNKDSHNKAGGLTSQRKGQRKFVFLKGCHQNVIEKVCDDHSSHQLNSVGYDLTSV